MKLELDKIRAGVMNCRKELLESWATYRADIHEIHDIWYVEKVEERLDVEAADLPLSGVIGAWALHEHRGGVSVIYGYCHRDYKDRDFSGGPIRTSFVVKIEDNIAVTLNSAYLLLSDADHDAVLRGDKNVEDLVK